LSLLFDTSAVIGLLERLSPETRRLVTSSPTRVAVSTLTLGELERGVRPDPTPQRLHTLSMAYTAMDHLLVPVASGPACFGHVAAHTSRRVGAVDCWIAATAVLGGHSLVTQDERLANEVAGVSWADTPWKAPQIHFVSV
jgi:predicted nucleic acid-binding protein